MKTFKMTIKIPILSSKSYPLPNEVEKSLENFEQKLFSVLYLNICNRSKNNELFQECLGSLHFSSSAICLPEIWCQSHETSNSNLRITGNTNLQQTKKNAEEEGLTFSYLNLFFTKSETTLL